LGLSGDWAKSVTEAKIKNSVTFSPKSLPLPKIRRWLSGQFLEELVRYQIESQDGHWRLQFEFDTAAWQRLVDHRLGRTVLLTNRMDWTAEPVAMGYSGQQEVERVFRGLKDGDWLG
jgi:hypothetical protein